MHDQAASIRLVKEVEKHESVYNYNLPEYSKRDVADRAWREIAAELYMTAAECRAKWRSFRTVLKRKINNGTAKTYYLYDAMQFCLPYIKSLNQSSSDNFSSNSKQEVGEVTDEIVDDSQSCENNIDDELEFEDESVSVVEPSSDMEQTFPQSPKIEDIKLPQLTACPSLAQSMKSLKSKSEGGIVEHSIGTYVMRKRARSDTPAQNDEKRETIEMFLLSLLPELEQFDDAQIKLFKRKVFSVIDEISS